MSHQLFVSPQGPSVCLSVHKAPREGGGGRAGEEEGSMYRCLKIEETAIQKARGKVGKTEKK